MNSKKNVLVLLLINSMIFNLFAQQDTEISKLLRVWLKNPKLDFSERLRTLSQNNINSEKDATLLCEALKLTLSKMGNFDELDDKNLYNFAILFQGVESKEAYWELDSKGIPLLNEIFKRYTKSKNISKQETDLVILKIFGIYKNNIGLKTLLHKIKENYKSNSYFWSIILESITETEDPQKINFLISELKGEIPNDQIGIAFLTMTNNIAREQTNFVHPFNNEKGYKFLSDLISSSSKEEIHNIIDVTSSIPFVSENYQNQLIEQVQNVDNIYVKIELAWAGSKLGKQEYIQKLIEYSKNYIFSSRATTYLKELKLTNFIPSEVSNSNFQALSEMSNWLSYPMEFGIYPDKEEIFYKKELYWPPSSSNKTIYLIKYTFNRYNTDGTDEIGIGLVGSVTFSLFGTENILLMKPEEILALHCNWELKVENYKNIESGLEILRRFNKDL